MASIQEEFTVDLKIVTNDMVSFGRWALGVCSRFDFLAKVSSLPPAVRYTHVRACCQVGWAGRAQASHTVWVPSKYNTVVRTVRLIAYLSRSTIL